MEKRKNYGKYKRGDVVYADFGHKPAGVQGGIRPCVIVSCDASNHEGAPMVTVCPLSSKLKDIPVHVQIKPNDVRGYRLKAISDFLPEDIQTVSKMVLRGKTGYIPVETEVMEQIDRALIRQLNLIRAARNMVMEELSDGSENKNTNNKRFVRYSEGAEMYSMSVSKFMQLAKDAKACYKVNQLVLINLDIIDEYLETFHIVDEDFYK